MELATDEVAGAGLQFGVAEELERGEVCEAGDAVGADVVGAELVCVDEAAAEDCGGGGYWWWGPGAATGPAEGVVAEGEVFLGAEVGGRRGGAGRLDFVLDRVFLAVEIGRAHV